MWTGNHYCTNIVRKVFTATKKKTPICKNIQWHGVGATCTVVATAGAGTVGVTETDGTDVLIGKVVTV